MGRPGVFLTTFALYVERRVMINLISHKRFSVSAGAEFTCLYRQTVHSFCTRGLKQDVRGEERLSFPKVRKKKKKQCQLLTTLQTVTSENAQAAVSHTKTDETWKEAGNRERDRYTTGLMAHPANFGIFRNRQIRTNSCERCDVDSTDGEMFIWLVIPVVSL